MILRVGSWKQQNKQFMTIFNYVAKFEASLDYRPAQEPDIWGGGGGRGGAAPPPPPKKKNQNKKKTKKKTKKKKKKKKKKKIKK